MIIKLWTIKDINGFDELKANKKLQGNAQFVDDDFRIAYDWMFHQMNKRLKVQISNSSKYPVWAWYQWRGSKRRKPDLRCSGYAEKGTKLYRIEFEIEEDEVLLSNFDLFHYVLNYWYLPKNEEDDNLFYKEMDKNNITLFDLQNFNKNSKELNKLRAKVKESWDLIFDLNRYDEYVNGTENEKSIQATICELRWESVIDVKEFIAK